MTIRHDVRVCAALLAVAALVAVCQGQEGTSASRAPGLIVRLYEVGQAMHALPEIARGELPSVERVVGRLKLDGKQGAFGPLVDNLVTEVVGFIKTGSGKYAFRLISDDGSRLWIDGQLVIDHDGLHGAEPKDGEIELDAGEHSLRVLHFDAGADEQLTLLWKDPNAGGQTDFALIPPAKLAHDPRALRGSSPGAKRIIPPLRRGRPGDGTPVVSEHPSFGEGTKPLPIDSQLSEWLGTGFIALIPPAGQEGLLRGAAGKGLRVGGGPCAWLPVDDGTAHYQYVARFGGGPYDTQWLVVAQPGESKRLFVDGLRAEPGNSACVFRFAPTDGRAAWNGNETFDILAVRAMSNGLEIEFTKPLDERVGWEAESYYVEQWPFDVEKRMGPARDGMRYRVRSASVSGDRKKVFLEIEGLKKSHVVYLRLLPPCISEDGELPWSTEAWYTLNAIPKDKPGKVLTPPAREPQNFLTDEEVADGWKLLFDGKSTECWRGYRKDSFPAGWVIKDDCLVRMGPGGDIATVDEYDDFELKLEWRICAAGNSGIFFRVDESVGWAWETGPEMQVLDNAEHYDGKNPKTSAGSNYALNAPVRDVTKPVGLFNEARIVVRGNHVEHWLNGVKVVEYELGSPEWKALVAGSKFAQWPKYGLMRKGRIVLQDHGDQVWYRNIKIRQLRDD